MKKIFLYGIWMIILINLVIASGSIQTNSISPVSVQLCGSYAQYTTITASQILNKVNLTLTSVSATLNFNNNPGLSFITPQTVSIGDISALSYSGNNPSWTIQCNSPNQGIYTAYVDYVSANGYLASSIDESYSLITVHDLNSFTGNISISEESTSESEIVSISDSTPTIKVSTSRNSICKGTLDADETYSNMDFIFYGNQIYHNYTFITPVSQGEHTVYVKCKDEFDNIMPDSILIRFKIDTANPVITVVSPGSVVLGDYTELKISINEEAECRFEDDDISFDSMDEFETENGNTFSTQLLGLDEGTYDYYVKCKDNVDNIALKEINFEVEIPPKARIIFEKEPPLGIGTYEITLIPSKTLREIPELTYEWETENDEVYKREVNLVKSGSYYKGFIIIKTEVLPRSAVFTFKAYDLSGNEGNEITEGGAFLVDTIAPIAPKDVAISASDDGILLDWYYDGEKPDHFNIYRSTTKNPGPIHLYDESKTREFLDDNIISNQLYYYKIAAVDDAGNVGSFSTEISTYGMGSGTNTAQNTQTNDPPTQETRDWKTRLEKDIETISIDLDWAETNIRDQESKEVAVQDLSLLKIVLDNSEAVSKLKTQILGLDVLRISDAEMRDSLSKGDALIARTKMTTPQSLEITKSTNILQATSESDIELAIDEFVNFKKSNYSDSQLKLYLKQMEKINENVKVETEIKTAKITYLDNSDETKVLVKKTFGYESSDELSNVIALEIIPKTVAGDIADVDIKTPDYFVINEDPVVSWAYDRLGFDKQTISYVVMTEDNSESVKSTKTILLIDPSISMQEKPSVLTGFSVFISKVNGVEVFGLIIGIVAVLGLGMYYMIVINEVDLSKYVPKNTFNKLKPKLQNKEKTSIKERPSQTNLVQEPKNAVDQAIIEERPGSALPSYAYLFKSENVMRTVPSQYFHVKSGDVVRSVAELKDVVEHMDDFTFYYHVNSKNNDFADWIDLVYDEKELSSLIRNQKTKEDLIKILEKIS